MQVRFLGESCLIITELERPPDQIARELNQNPPPGLIEAVPAFHQLALYFEPPLGISGEFVGGEVTSPEEIFRRFPPQVWGGGGEGLKKKPPLCVSGEGVGGEVKEIPAFYQGQDLLKAAQALNLSPDHLINLHHQAAYTVEAIGFCPGFPYLSGLPPELQGLPRLNQPRAAVEPGSIAITGDQCCIYPLARPGGWNVIARTPLQIVDPEANHFPLTVGDQIRFIPISQSEYEQFKGQKL